MPCVMICDDQPVSVNRLIDRLKYEGYDVDLTISAEACLDRTEEKSYDAFVLDMDLGPAHPDHLRHGLELAKRLWRQPKTADVPIIGITGHTLSIAKEAKAFGLASFMKKPLDPKTFLDNLNDLLKVDQKSPEIPSLEEVETQYERLRSLVLRARQGEDVETEIQAGFQRLRHLQDLQADALENNFNRNRRCFDPKRAWQAVERAKGLLGDEDTATNDKTSKQ